MVADSVTAVPSRWEKGVEIALDVGRCKPPAICMAPGTVPILSTAGNHCEESYTIVIFEIDARHRAAGTRR